MGSNVDVLVVAESFDDAVAYCKRALEPTESIPRNALDLTSLVVESPRVVFRDVARSPTYAVATAKNRLVLSEVTGRGYTERTFDAAGLQLHLVNHLAYESPMDESQVRIDPTVEDAMFNHRTRYGRFTLRPRQINSRISSVEASTTTAMTSPIGMCPVMTNSSRRFDRIRSNRSGSATCSRGSFTRPIRLFTSTLTRGPTTTFDQRCAGIRATDSRSIDESGEVACRPERYGRRSNAPVTSERRAGPVRSITADSRPVVPAAVGGTFRRRRAPRPRSRSR